MFITTVSPRFGDIDGLGHITNTVLPVWFEIGRNSIFRLFSPDLNLSPDKWHLILVRTEFDFLRQMYFRSDVEIRTFISGSAEAQREDPLLQVGDESGASQVS